MTEKGRDRARSRTLAPAICLRKGGNIREREGGAMGQLCCFPFSQAEEKISKCLMLLSSCVGVCCWRNQLD